ncbi:hypothetical protein EON64_14020, partial [archaeon]
MYVYSYLTLHSVRFSSPPSPLFLICLGLCPLDEREKMAQLLATDTLARLQRSAQVMGCGGQG